MNNFNPSELVRIDTNRLADYTNNLNFYNGSQWEKKGRHRQLVFNYAKVALDKVTSYLMQGLTFACYPGDAVLTLSETKGKELDELKAKVVRAEHLLRDVYESNNLQQLDWETEIDTAILGDGCYKVIWDPDEKRIKITTPDIRGIYAWWLGDDLSNVWRVASRYTLTQDEVTMLYGNEIATPSARNDIEKGPRNDTKGLSLRGDPSAREGTRRSNLVKVTEIWTAKDFELFLDNDRIQSKPNPYGFIPFIIFPNLREPKQFWGTSDIPSIKQPQRELNRAVSQLSRILELSGNPIAVLENIGSSEDIQVQPGAVWTIPEDAKAYLLDLLQGGGIRLHIDYIDLIYRCLHDISETPRAAYGGTERDLSGAALQIELGALIQKVTRKRTIRTNAYHQRTDMILKLAQKYLAANFDGITHRVVWGPILPQDTQRQAQNEQLLVQAGVHSRRTAMDAMGIMDPDEEFTRWLEEREKILKMNQEFRAASTRGGARERAVAADMEVPE